MPKARKPVPVAHPEMRLLTVSQAENTHPGTKGRWRTWIHRADAGDPDYGWLRPFVVRVGRSVFLNEHALSAFFYQRSAMPPAPSRRT